MKKTVSISLAILGTTILASCSRHGETQTAAYASIDECVAAGLFFKEDCVDSYRRASIDHDTNGPAFETKAQCEDEFGKDKCEPTSTGHVDGQSRYMPYMQGFIIGRGAKTVDGVYFPAVAAQPLYQPQNKDRDSSGYYGGGGGFVTKKFGGFKMSSSASAAAEGGGRTMTLFRSGFGSRGFGHS